MRTSSVARVRELYDDWAGSYSELMDSEIDLPIYSDTLTRLAERIASVHGPLIDTSCGPGHLLARYRERYDPDRSLVGIDLSPRMVADANARLGPDAEIVTGDMRDLHGIDSDSSAAVLSFFAIHHLDPKEILAVFQEWHRVLRPAGQLVVAAWEGTGAIDYGDESDIVALRYTRDQLTKWAQDAGFVVNRCVVEPVEEMPMSAIHLEGTKEK